MMASHSQMELNPKTDQTNTHHLKSRATQRTPLDTFADMRLVNPEQDTPSDAEVTLKKLIDINENYLSEKGILYPTQSKSQTCPLRPSTATKYPRKQDTRSTTASTTRVLDAQ